MATASVPMNQKSTECSVCHKLFTEPKLLSCGDLLCRQCLLSCLKSHEEAECPVCQSLIVEAKVRKNKSVEDITDGFPTDQAMKMIVAADRHLSQRHNCCVCENVAATFMCTSCGDMLCKACAKAHRKMSTTKQHTVEDISTLTAEKLVSLRRETCPVHEDKISQVFCPTHGASICLLCATTDHQNCTKMTKLETEREEARKKLAEMVAKLSAGEAELDRAIGQLDQHLQETEKNMRSAFAEIEALCDRLESVVKDFRRFLTELTKKACSDAKEAVQEGKTCLLKRRGKLTAHKRVVERVQEIKTRAALKGMASVLIARMGDLDCSATLPPDAKIISTVTLAIDQDVISRVEQKLSELCHVEVIPANFISQAAPFCFHDNHGTDVIISKHHLTAEKRTDTKGEGVVVSSLPMKINNLYEIHLDKRERKPRKHMLPMGVVTSAPEDGLPKQIIGWKSAIIIGQSTITGHGTKITSNLGKEAAGAPEGSRLGLSLDSSRNLRLHLNGECQGTAAESVAEPAYFAFQLEGPYKKVTALPVTHLV